MVLNGHHGEPRRLAVNIMAGSKELVALWVTDRVRDMVETPENTELYEAIGIVKDGAIIGGVIYQDYRKLKDGTYDISLSVAGEPGWLTPKTLRAIFEYPFNRLNCSRITTLASKSNRRARDLNVRVGFRLEGVIKGGGGVGRDSILYGMTRDECRWIRNRNNG